MLTFQVSKEKPVAWTKQLGEVEITAKKLQEYNVAAEFKIVQGNNTYVIYGKDAKGETAIKGLNGVLATCEKVKNEINMDPNIAPKVKENLLKSITAYQTEVISNVKKLTAKSEFSTSSETGPGPMDIYLRLAGYTGSTEYGAEKNAKAKAFELVKKYPVLDLLTPLSLIGTGEPMGNPYYTYTPHNKNDLPSKHLQTNVYKAPAKKDGSEYGKASNYELNGMSVDYIPAKTVKK